MKLFFFLYQHKSKHLNYLVIVQSFMFHDHLSNCMGEFGDRPIIHG